MPKLRVHNFSVSLDGYGAGPNQSRQEPLGENGELLHEWMFATKTVKGPDGTEGLDDEAVVRGDDNIGATIMGRNMFGPVRGPWPDHAWKGWWGENPPYHHDVFVMTHHPRPSFDMAGGTTFHFTDETPEAVLERAFEAAGGKDVRLGGGASTVQQFLDAGLVDELHFVIVPVLLGGGERLFDNLGDLTGYRVAELVSSPAATHARIVRA
ncbi:dihydrofolate reductase family protein [Actinokineospora sp. HUAS TT18]|uniref:dihydrofolate reductase family protein n=1 Tax=Actinokineospora sp. HUAS TT18 TaxID=3447451 RepID=UPI003F524CB1